MRNLLVKFVAAFRDFLKDEESYPYLVELEMKKCSNNEEKKYFQKLLGR